MIRARLKLNQVEYAVKVVDKAFIVKHHKESFVMKEKECMTLLRHPNIVRLHYTFQDKHSLCMLR